MKKKEYQKLASQVAAKSPVLKNCVLAFSVGGAICTLGEALRVLFLSIKIEKDVAAALVPISLIFLGAFFTALGLYEKLAKYAGAGTVIPITGFANSIVSPAIEFKSEGLVLGMAAKMFTVAGPVLVYGIVASVVYGLAAYALGVI